MKKLVWPAVLALLLSSLALFAGWYQDDYIHVAACRGEQVLAATCNDLYSFTDGDAAHVKALMARGPLPWWTSPTLKVRFLRPFGVALVRFDQLALRFHPVLQHAHSLLWFALFVVAASALYRSVLTPTVATLACFLFAVDDTHWMIASWIAARHTLVAGFFAVLCVRAHVRARQRGATRPPWQALVLLLLALLAGETGLGALGYLAAYELVGSRDARRARMAAFAPHLVLTIVYLTVYSLLGYGTRGSGIYANPIREPFAFIASAWEKLPPLTAELLVGWPADLWLVLPQARAAYVIAALVGIALFAALLVRGLRRHGEDDRRSLYWLMLGAALSLIPSLGGFVGGRLLALPSVGAAAVIAAILVDAWKQVRGPGTGSAERWMVRTGAILLALIHGAFAPLALATNMRLLRQLSDGEERVAHSIELQRPDARVVVLVASDPLAAMYPPAVRATEPPPRPTAWWLISSTPRDHVVTRIGERAIRLSAGGAAMNASDFPRLLRSDREPFSAGDEVVLDGLTVKVVTVDAGRPTAVEVRWDDAPLEFVAWRDGRLSRVALPPVGGELRIAWTPGPVGL